MKSFAKILGPAAIAASILPALLYMGGAISLDLSKHLLLAATIAWFVASAMSFWASGMPSAGEADAG
ncbi:MAG: hypothetical protein AAF589_09085 [Planctomycetota bacterium]